jgi:hypothetical protein
MNNGRCLGLVGGLGIGATIHYKKLAKMHEEHGRALDIVITNAEIARVREYVETSDRNGLAPYLVGLISRPLLRDRLACTGRLIRRNVLAGRKRASRKL